MTDSALRLKDELLRLSEDDREELARLLLDSLPPADEQTEAAWAAELERRFREVEAGQAVELPAEQVFAELRAKCR